MNLTIKTIRNIAVSNFVILGLVACSSSPAPWTQVDDSPWGAKRKAETESLSKDATSMSDPVLLGEPEAVVIDDGMMADAATPEAANVQTPVVTETVTVDTTAVEPVIVESYSPEQEILALPASDFAVQVYAAKSIASIDKFKNAKGVQELKTVATRRSGSIMYVLVDVYPDRASAKSAANELADRTGAKPWIRSVAGLQKIIAQ